MWIQVWQDEHSIEMDERFFLQMLHFQTGPGFCSIPARISNSQSKLAGSCFVVRLVKNTN